MLFFLRLLFHQKRKRRKIKEIKPRIRNRCLLSVTHFARFVGVGKSRSRGLSDLRCLSGRKFLRTKLSPRAGPSSLPKKKVCVVCGTCRFVGEARGKRRRLTKVRPYRRRCSKRVLLRLGRLLDTTRRPFVEGIECQGSAASQGSSCSSRRGGGNALGCLPADVSGQWTE